VQPQIVALAAEKDSSNNKENLKAQMVPQLGRGYEPGSLIDL